MSKFKSQGLNNTFKNAGKGIRIVLKSENNIRVHFFVALFVIMLGLVMDLSIAKLCILLLALVGMAKDISAGAVMFATFIAVAIGLIMFGTALYSLI